MTFEEFVALAGDDAKTEKRRDYRNETGCEPFLELEWQTGGASGGDCWGADVVHYTCDDGEPDFVAVESILAQVCPDLKLLQFRRLMRELEQHMEHDENTYREYYGNNTEYAVKRLRLRDLYDTLESMGLLP